MFGEGGEVGDFEGEVGQVGADDDGAAGGEGADFDEFVAVRRFEEDEFGAAGGFVAFDFFEAEDVFVEGDGFFEIVDSVTGVQELGDHRQRVHATGAGWGQAEELRAN